LIPFPVRAEYPVSFLQRLLALLKQMGASEQKTSYYNKANESMKTLIEEGIGLDGTMAFHEPKRLSKEKLQKERQFLVFSSEMTKDFIQEQLNKSEKGEELNMDDFIKFVEEEFFVDEETEGKDYSDELYEAGEVRQDFSDEVIREAYVYALINRGYSISQTPGEEGLIEQIKTKGDEEDDTLREMLYTNNLALQGLIFETMQMIMFEQIALEMEAVQMLMEEQLSLLKYDYKQDVEEETEK
jgi:hypothetical protein